MSLIVYAIPVFFLLIGIELLLTKTRNLSYYRMSDAISNLSCGIGSQISGIFLKTFTFIGYTYLYQHSIWKIADSWYIFILLFIGVDFFYYWFHRLAHEISFLWGSHIVHHQSEEYNLTVALRQAWLQGAFSWVFYLPLAVIGFSPATFIVVVSLQTLYQFWIHTRLINKMHPAFEYVFNTPSHHRVHHGVNPQYIDRNHGGTLIIFDRWFGTFEIENEPVVYGVTKQTNSWNPLWVNFEYWFDLAQQTATTKGLKNRIFTLVKNPGWAPLTETGNNLQKPFEPNLFTKYNTEISSGLTNYAFFQFIVVLFGTTGFLLFQGNVFFAQNSLIKIAVAMLLIFSIVNIGGIFDCKSWVTVLEYIRLIALVAIVILLMKDTSLFIFASVVAIVVALISAFWFTKYKSEFSIKNSSYVSATIV